MKKNLNNKINSGFTLIEIIVVMIIVGILASIAVPGLFGNVSRSKAAEAFSNISAIRPAVEACIAAHPGNEVASCSAYWVQTVNPGVPCTGTAVAAGVPAGACSTNFAYVVYNTGSGNSWTGSGSGTGYYIVAYFISQDAWGADYVIVQRLGSPTGSFGNITCAGGGALVGAC